MWYINSGILTIFQQVSRRKNKHTFACRFGGKIVPKCVVADWYSIFYWNLIYPETIYVQNSSFCVFFPVFFCLHRCIDVFPIDKQMKILLLIFFKYRQLIRMKIEIFISVFVLLID